MKRFGIKITGVAAACLLALGMLFSPAQLVAQGTASIHGRVINPAGSPVVGGTVRLTTDKSPGNPATKKYDYSFPLDPNGGYKGDGIKPGTYVAVAFQGNNSVDFILSLPLSAGEDKAADFDMTRKEYMDKMSAEDKAALEEYKKQHAAQAENNKKIDNLNNLLKQARADTLAGNFAPAIKSMQDATQAKPEEALLWDTLGDAQLGDANAAFKAAGGKASDPAVQEKFNAAVTSYQKTLTLNAAAAKPDTKLTATANNQLGTAFGRLGKTKDASAAFEAAATADKPSAGMYYYNEAAILFNGNDTDGAAAAADKAIAADPAKADAYFIKGQSLIQKATVDPKTNTPVAPPGCLEAYQKYLDLAPTGPHADDVKQILAGFSEQIKTSFKGAKK